MTSLRDYIVRGDFSQRTSRTGNRRPLREDVGEVQIMHSPSLDVASVALTADINLEERAARMNEFWDALVEFQRRAVFVLAICVD